MAIGSRAKPSATGQPKQKRRNGTYKTRSGKKIASNHAEQATRKPDHARQHFAVNESALTGELELLNE